MKRAPGHRYKGLTLIEVMIAVLISVVIVIGALSYMYACALNARKADVRATASRLGLLLLDAWKNSGGATTTAVFDPEYILDFVPAADISPGEGPPGGLGAEWVEYRMKVDGANYFVTLSFFDEFYETREDPLRHLNVRVAWNQDNSAAGLTSGYQSISLTKFAYY